MVTVTLNEKQLSMICDALYTTSHLYSMDAQDYLRAASKTYSDLAKQLDQEHQAFETHNHLRQEHTKSQMKIVPPKT